MDPWAASIFEPCDGSFAIMICTPPTPSITYAQLLETQSVEGLRQEEVHDASGMCFCSQLLCTRWMQLHAFIALENQDRLFVSHNATHTHTLTLGLMQC
eukprot:1971468-Amphidinium_carterae.1